MHGESHWRREARAVIERALLEGRAAGLSGAALLARVDAAYPFGERAMWPNKIWLDQRRRQCGSLLPERSCRGKKTGEEERLERLEADMHRVVESMKGGQSS